MLQTRYNAKHVKKTEAFCLKISRLKYHCNNARPLNR